MRELTVEQKKLLDKWYEENKSHITRGFLFDAFHSNLFSCELLRQLKEIHDTEVLYQEINRYIRDKFSSEGK